MTAADILKIVGTVAVTQVVIDVLANRWVFNTESYDRLCRALLRAQTLEAKARASKATNAEKHAKKLGRHVTEREALAALVAKKHATPAMGGSVAFLILYRILSAEHAGKVVAVLPFVPFRLLRRITLRGLDFGPEGPRRWQGQSGPAPSHSSTCWRPRRPSSSCTSCWPGNLPLEPTAASKP